MQIEQPVHKKEREKHGGKKRINVAARCIPRADQHGNAQGQCARGKENGRNAAILQGEIAVSPKTADDPAERKKGIQDKQ